MNPIYAVAGVAVVAIAVGSFIAGHKQANDSWQDKWDKEQARIVKLQLEHEKSMREKERFYTSQVERINQDAKSALQSLQVDIANGDATANSLREQVRKYSARARQCGNSATGGGSSSATNASDVLADLHASLEQRSRELAEEADKRRVAGLACQDQYNSIRAGNNGK